MRDHSDWDRTYDDRLEDARLDEIEERHPEWFRDDDDDDDDTQADEEDD